MTTDQPAILLENVGLRRGSRWLLRDVTWRVPQGVCAAIVGPNGSGKSTLARILAGHMWPSSGTCRVLGGLFGQIDLPALRRSIRLLQPAGPCDIDPQLSAREVVLTGFFGTLGLYDAASQEMTAEAEAMLRRVGLSAVADHSYWTLSSGERVRSLIARALVIRPRLLILDEPTAGLDLLGREQILATIQGMFDDQAEPPTVVLITHHVEELPPVTSQVLVLCDGRSAGQGVPGDVLTDGVLSRAYGCPVGVRRSNGRFYLEVNPGAWDSLMAARDAG